MINLSEKTKAMVLEGYYTVFVFIQNVTDQVSYFRFSVYDINYEYGNCVSNKLYKYQLRRGKIRNTQKIK